MRIAYYLHWHKGPESGVFKKITMQIESWKREGHEVRLFIFTGSDSQLVNQLPEINTDYEIISYHSFLNRFVKASKIADRILCYKPEILYFRLSGFYPSFLKLTDHIPMIIEVNSDDVSEFRHASFARRVHNSLSRHFLFGHCAGIVFVSDELSRLDYYSKYGKPYEVIGNGIDLSRYIVGPPPKNEKPALIFIGSNLSEWYDYEWNGVDKILWLASQVPEFDFYIIGIDHRKEVPENVRFTGFLGRSDYQSIMEKGDVGIGTLALHRKLMDEASPLKVREYLANGLPVIVGYKDTDLSESLPFVLPIGNYEDNVKEHVQMIVRFVKKWKGTRIDRQHINSLDVRVKERKRLEFMQHLTHKAS